MFPVICEIGPFTVYSYGLMLAIAFVVCLILFQRDAKRQNIHSVIVSDLLFWVLISGLVGARIFYVFLNLSYFTENPLEVIMLHRGGLVWYGGFISASLSGIWYLKRHSLPMLKMFDLVAPYIALGQAIGRIGCFLNGCCYGKPVPWGVYFPVHAERLHPTQAYSSIALFGIFLLLRFLQNRKHADGQIFFMYVVLHSCSRFIVEFFRADTSKFAIGLSLFQIISIILCCGSLYGIFYLRSQGRR